MEGIGNVGSETEYIFLFYSFNFNEQQQQSNKQHFYLRPPCYT